MKAVGFLLLLSGWGIVLAAAALLRSWGPQVAFILAGIGVEVLGLTFVLRSHRSSRGASE